MKITSRRWFKIVLVTTLVLIGLELYLRYYWGFCDSVLMMENKHYEYIAQPNQDRYRFRHHVQYNSFSMRSPEPDTSAYIIIGFGDSVINGGVMVDNDSLATNLLSARLSVQAKKNIQVLNVGAGSWGPDNNYAYLLEKGDFNARLIFLVVSSHDAFDNMDFKPVIDKIDRYESGQYFSAIWELLAKYALPRLIKRSESSDQYLIKEGTEFNTGFNDFYVYCKEKDIPLLIYLNPEKRELDERKYNWQGQKIIEFCKQRSIKLIQGLAYVQQSDYRGSIHMNNAGQRKMSEALFPVILSEINN